MYKIEIKNIDTTVDGYHKNEPTNYRVSIKFKWKTETILITREYFKVGFRDGEHWDGIFVDARLGIDTASIITRKISDKEYLRKIEEKLIKRFYDECLKSIENVNLELKKKIKHLNWQRKNYEGMTDTLSKSFRSQKLKKIKNVIKNME